MATRRSSRRDKTPKKEASEDESAIVEMSGPSTRSAKPSLKVESPESREPSPGPSSSPRKRMKKKEDLEDDAYASAMLLDVLAQVASDRLETEPKRLSTGKKPSKRVLSTMELLSFEHLQQLNDKMLVNLFTELTANEMSRNYEFKCMLMPEDCHTVFTSYGNEFRGRSAMLAHLKQHLAHIKEAGADSALNFVAEPVHARKKRNAVHMRKVWSKSTKKMVVIQRPPDAFTTLKKKKKSSRDTTKVKIEDIPDEEEEQEEQEDEEEEEEEVVEEEEEVVEQEEDEEEEALVEQHVEVDGAIPMHEIEISTSEEASHYEATGSSMEEKEQFIVDLLRRTQPYQDHSYTTVFGKRFGITESEEEIDESLNSQGGRVGHFAADSVHYAEAGLPGAPPDNMPSAMMQVQEVLVQDVDPMDDMRPGRKSRYPPMPKASLAQQGRLEVLAEIMSSSDEEIDRQMTLQANGFKPAPVRKSRELQEGSTDWERRMALRCIRDLRLRKRDDCLLKCKICENKTFTATATLMYHYRSHAGIKPFLCMICNTTFTRQHSLNYHMLIHNNQSRFTCKDCGRKFRHPSHFKEHMRRHTGETPFHCADCPLRFKTRNTYKRHLRTRHNKLLTADGIHVIQCLTPPVPVFQPEPVYQPAEPVVIKPEMDGPPDVAVIMEMTDSEQSDLEQENQENNSSSSSLKAVAMNLHHEQIVLPPSHTASNRLLQFCSQVVSQEVPG